MILAFIALLSLLSIAVDLILLRKVRKTYREKPWLGWLYLAHFLIIDLIIVAAVSLYRESSDAGSEGSMRTILWAFFLFFISFFPKFVYLIFVALGRLFDLIRRTRTKVFSRIGIVAALALFCLMLWSATVGRNRIITEHVTIESDKIPASFDGYKIALFTDLHVGNEPANNRFIRNLVERINNEHPDLVVNAGDLVNVQVNELNDSVTSILGSIRATDGVCSVFGNHDLGIYMNRHSSLTPAENTRQLAEKQHKMGWTVLDNETVYMQRGNDSLSVTGVNFPANHKLNNRHTADFARCDFATAYQGVPDSLFNVLIAHTPEVWDAARASGPADLTLSGHVHAMQFKIRIGNWAWSPARWMYTRWSGLYEEEGKKLFINDGLGYVMYPMRIGTYPSITVFTLRSAVRP